MTTKLQAFKDRVLGDLLPTFCADPKRGLDRSGFKEGWKKVAERDAADFLLALDEGLVEHRGRGIYGAPRSQVCEQFFWEGRKSISPRPFSLWIEPIITVAALSRLHFKWGWPRELIGTQSLKWEFDVVGYRASDADNEYLACEVKKTVSELNKMVDLMQRFATGYAPQMTKREEKNAFKKFVGLQERRASIFWALGPNDTNMVFRMTCTDGGGVAFQPAPIEALTYPDK